MAITLKEGLEAIKADPVTAGLFVAAAMGLDAMPSGVHGKFLNIRSPIDGAYVDMCPRLFEEYAQKRFGTNMNLTQTAKAIKAQGSRAHGMQ